MSVQQAGLGWEEFTTQLARAIRELPDREFLVVQDGATHAYVQFAADHDSVAAECTSNSSQQPTHPADDNGEQLLAQSGWTLYSGAQPNWTSRLHLPAITARFDQLAHSCVVALRDVYGTSAPSNSATPHGVSRESCTQAGPTPTRRSLPSMRRRTPCRSRASPSR